MSGLFVFLPPVRTATEADGNAGREEEEMEENVAVIETEEVHDADEREMMAAFEAGEEALTGRPPEPETAETDAPTEPEQGSEAVEYAQLTKAQLDRLLANAESVEKIAPTYAQQMDTAFGHIGGLMQKFKDLEARRAQSLTVAPEDYAELREEFPEIAEQIRKGQERVLAKLANGVVASGLDEAAASRLIESRLADLALATQREVLEDLHPDWEEITGPDGSQTPYRQWLATMPQSYQARIASTGDAGIIARSIDKFKQATAPKPQPSARSAPSAEARRRVLTDAVLPRGGAQPVGGGKSAEDYMMAEFRGR